MSSADSGGGTSCGGAAGGGAQLDTGIARHCCTQTLRHPPATTPRVHGIAEVIRPAQFERDFQWRGTCEPPTKNSRLPSHRSAV